MDFGLGFELNTIYIFGVELKKKKKNKGRNGFEGWSMTE
jgi:hypothetical protein